MGSDHSLTLQCCKNQFGIFLLSSATKINVYAFLTLNKKIIFYHAWSGSDNIVCLDHNFNYFVGNNECWRWREDILHNWFMGSSDSWSVSFEHRNTKRYYKLVMNVPYNVVFYKYFQLNVSSALFFKVWPFFF